jgi:hypothetical protein
MKKISQREAHRLLKRVAELESQQATRNARWGASYPGGMNFHTLKVDVASAAAIRTAQCLQHAVVVRIDNDSNISFYALPNP